MRARPRKEIGRCHTAADLWTLRRLGRKPRRLLRCAPNHGPTRFSRSRYPSGSIQLGRPAGSPSGESSTLTKTCRRTGNCPYSRLRKVLASPCSSSWTATAFPPWPRAEATPLELAVYIGACISTPHRVRMIRGRLVTTVRELRDFLFGPTWHPSPTGNRPGDWERVRTAALNASDLWLPLENGDLWRTVAVRKIPPADYRPEYLDRQVIFDVELPDGAAHGPVIDRLELARLRLVSGPKFRAYVAAHSIAWRPGVTRRRHPRNRSVHLWSSNPAHYPVLTAADRRRLAFGSEDKKEPDAG